MLRGRILAAGGRTMPPHVCIVGAGMTGLRCAEVLIKHGMKVTIVEGRDRIGGRIHQIKHHDHLIDLGPNWIHGTVENPIVDLAHETNTTTHSWADSDSQQSVIDAEGKMMEEAEAKDASDRMWAVIASAFQFSDENADRIGPEESLLDFFRSSAEELFGGDETTTQNGDSSVDGENGGNENTRPQKKMMDERTGLLRMAEFWGVIIGSPVEKQSLKFFWLEEGVEGENLFVASTYKAILDRVAEIPLAKADIQFSKKVVSIESLEAEEEGQEEGKYLSITTADGETQHFDEVVVTTPLGWLKRNQQSFKPPLPARLSQAIDSISYGNLEKAYITFPTAFWQANNTSSSSSSSSSSSFYLWMHPLYAPTTNPNHWLQQAVNLAVLPDSTSHPTLLFYIQGPCSIHLTSLLARNPVSKHEALLREFFEPYYSRLPQYDANDPHNCKPVALTATSWSTDEMAGYGSYSNFQTGLTDADTDIEVMREGLPDRRIWLAGEHTAPFIASGTVTGAYWAGEAVAERIVERYFGKEGGEEVKGVEEEKAKGKGKGEPRGMDGMVR
ncbi:MAG: hypothetical protein M1816_007855 [Peltula sp. TS41687]|nr:MAG: hypothetical protein M1816_007855 [Peltula sp. TS41687]